MDILNYLPDNLKRLKIRIPVSGSITICESVRKIIDTPEFQRLRGVRQLGPTIFVYPGANHTRFEHSLGVYNNAISYLKKLMIIERFQELIQPKEKNIRILVLSALLHDIGHYPYSHWIEEIDKFSNGYILPSHEKRALEIITGSSIERLLTNDWQVDITDIQKTIESKSNIKKQGLLNSILSSIIDIDKMDYLKRDSIHCGVNYGNGIDTERLLDALYFFEKGESQKICITGKGKSALLTILTTRNIMYQEVYWHKTVRICDSMFKRFFYEYASIVNPSESQWNHFTQYTDDEFTSKLYSDAVELKNEKLISLIKPFAFKGRDLYKLIYIHNADNDTNTGKDDNNDDTIKYFRKVNGLKYSELIEHNKLLVEKLKVYIPTLTPLDVIIEKTPIRVGHEKDHLTNFKIYNQKLDRYEGCSTQIKTLNEYLAESQQSYILCSPIYYEQLSDLVKKGIFESILWEL